jgi:hypothetical protein
MKTVYMRYNPEHRICTIFENSDTIYKDLYLFMMAIEEIQDPDLIIEIIDSKNLVSIWTLDSFKPKVELEFDSVEAKEHFDDTYRKYYHKRWNEMPQVQLSIPDWHELQNKWEQIKKLKPAYVMCTLEKSGFFDKVDIIAKNELTNQDLANIQKEYEKFLRYQKAEAAYYQSLSDYHYEWRGPQDDEYEADIMKFYK